MSIEKFIHRNGQVYHMTLLAFILLCLVTLTSTQLAKAQSTGTTSSIELLGTITANQAVNGLGFNLNPQNDWEWAAAAAAGATHARIQCSWASVEQQTPPPGNVSANPKYVETPDCIAGFASAIKYGIHPTVVAAYGAPFHNILSLSISGGAAVGATSLNVEFQAGVGGDTLASIKFPYDYICLATLPDTGIPNSIGLCSSYFSRKHSYQGTFITGVTQTDSTHATITLASALTTAIPATPITMTGCSMAINTAILTCTSGGFTPAMVGTTQLVIPGITRNGLSITTIVGTYISPTQVTVPTTAYNPLNNAIVPITTIFAINEILYPSTTTNSATEPSVVAYGNYVSFLAQDMASRGVTGDIELWNEPPWAADPWDYRPALYDVWTGATPFGANYGFVSNLQAKAFPAGITATWNGTSGNGYSSLLAVGMYNNSGVYFNQPSAFITRESFHPYGNTPEAGNWEMSCFQTALVATTYPADNVFTCQLPGEKMGNYVYAVFLDAQAKLKNPSYGISHSVTETGTVAKEAGYRIPQARFEIRQYLTYQADGITPVEFFKLYSGNADPDFSFIQEVGTTSSYTINPNYASISGFMADIKQIGNLPVATYTSASLPSIANYNGTYPLSTVHMVGARVGATANSDMFAVWQRSYSSCEASGANCSAEDWITMASPAAAPVTITIPSGMKVTSLTNLTTRATVSYTTSGSQISFNVADDPIEVLVDPKTKLTLGGPNLGESTTQIPASYFGLTTLHYVTDTPSIPYGITRSWNADGVDWADVNSFPGVYNFGALDKLINFSASSSAPLIYTFGRTPRWASSQPNSIISPYGTGQCAPPSNLSNWDNYVRAIVVHAAGKITYWELWDQPQTAQYYCGSVSTMVLMAQHAYEIIKSIDPLAVILSPSVTGTSGPTWLDGFLKAGGGRYVDAIAFHGYPGQTAENIATVIPQYTTVMQQNHITKPLWDTETSWSTGITPALTSQQQAGFVAKYYMLDWSLGVSSANWYAYDAATTLGPLWSSGGGLSAAGTAYEQVYNWMVGADMSSACSKDGNNIWACSFTRANGYQAQATWITNSSISVTVPSVYTQYRDLTGTVHAITNSTTTIGDEPILLENQSP